MKSLRYFTVILCLLATPAQAIWYKDLGRAALNVQVESLVSETVARFLDSEAGELEGLKESRRVGRLGASTRCAVNV